MIDENLDAFFSVGLFGPSNWDCNYYDLYNQISRNFLGEKFQGNVVIDAPTQQTKGGGAEDTTFDCL